MRFPVFARYAGASRAYVHIVSYGAPVEVFGLKVRSGDLLYADCHGVVNIPLAIAAEVAQVASRIRAKEASIVQACLSTHLSRTELLDMIRNGQIS
jgi:regulator of RNase E activity RraA